MRAPLVFLAFGILFSACGEGAATGDTGSGIVASIHPVAAVIRELAGESTDVRVLLPPGSHADTYEPTPRLAEAVEAAGLVVMVGGGLDAWVGTSAADHVLVLADSIELLEDDGHGGSGNPHVWVDPILMRDRVLPRLERALIELSPADSAAISRRAAAYADSLTALNAEITALLADVPGRRFVAAHPAWTYFAERYGLEEVGVLQPSPGEEIGTRGLALLVDEARRRDVRAVIAEPQLGRQGVSALANELNVNIEVADPMGGRGLDGRDRYTDLMRWNARAFARALGGS